MAQSLKKDDLELWSLTSNKRKNNSNIIYILNKLYYGNRPLIHGIQKLIKDRNQISSILAQ